LKINALLFSLSEFMQGSPYRSGMKFEIVSVEENRHTKPIMIMVKKKLFETTECNATKATGQIEMLALQSDDPIT